MAVTLTDEDDIDKDGKCTMVVSLMKQSDDLQLYDHFISFFLYKVTPQLTQNLCITFIQHCINAIQMFCV